MNFLWNPFLYLFRFINNNFSAYTNKSQALSHSDLLTSRIFSYLKHIWLASFPPANSIWKQTFPFKRTTTGVTSHVSEPKLSDQQLWHHRGNLLIMGSVVSQNTWVYCCDPSAPSWGSLAHSHVRIPNYKHLDPHSLGFLIDSHFARGPHRLIFVGPSV